jgi:hypothetical protein
MLSNVILAVLTVAMKYALMNVIWLSVVMVNVVAPLTMQPSALKIFYFWDLGRIV